VDEFGLHVHLQSSLLYLAANFAPGILRENKTDHGNDAF